MFFEDLKVNIGQLLIGVSIQIDTQEDALTPRRGVSSDIQCIRTLHTLSKIQILGVILKK